MKRDRSNSTIKLWKHLEKFHIKIYKQLRSFVAPNTLNDYFSKTSKFVSKSPEQIEKECIDLIVKKDAPFILLDHPQFKRFFNYLAQCEAYISSSMSRRPVLEKVFEDERDKLRELLRPIERVSLITDTWTTINNVAVLGITIYWIDDMWKLQEKVLSVEELGASHQGAILTDVLYRVLKEFDLAQKVSNYCLTIVHYQSLMYICLKNF